MLIATLISGVSLFIFIFIFRKQAFDIGISKVGLNVTILEIGIGLILIAMHEWYGNRRHIGSTLTAPLRWLGRNSYEIYLIHQFFIILIANFLFNAKQSWPLITLCYFVVVAISGLAGQFVSTYFSEPLNRFVRSRNRYFTKTILNKEKSV
jgi:peptidoglycan/LPS O-acetylase OafA/YrhL